VVCTIHVVPLCLCMEGTLLPAGIHSFRMLTDGAKYNVALACHQHRRLESIIAITRIQTLDELSFGIDVQVC